MSTFDLSLRELKRTPGAKKDFSLQGCFPIEIVTGLISWPAQRYADLTGTLESVGDGVLVKGTADVLLEAECSRCLTVFPMPTQAEFQELFVYPEHQTEYEAEDVSLIHEETIDLADLVRDSIILVQPLIPLCQPDCLGLCPSCGAELNTDPEHGHDDTVDSRWLGLAEWGKM